MSTSSDGGDDPPGRGGKRTLPPPHRGAAPAPLPPRAQPPQQPAPPVTARQPAQVVPTPSPHAETLTSFPQAPAPAAPSAPAPLAPRPQSPSTPPPVMSPYAPGAPTATAPAVSPFAPGAPTISGPAVAPPHPMSGPIAAPSGPIPQALSGPATQPQPFAGSGPIPSYASQPTTAPYGSGPTHGVPLAYGGSPSGPYPSGGALPPGERGLDLDELPGSAFVKFLKLSMRRAFRLRIEPSEVLADEKATLESASPPIYDQNLQAFLAWRRSVLFVVASALIPLTLIGIIDALRTLDWKAIFFVKFTPAAAEAIFLWVCWSQLKRWADWRQQRRKLFYGWLLFMLTPFVVFIYPLNAFFEEIRGAVSSAEKRAMLASLGVDGLYRNAVMPFVFSMIAMLQLAPKAISLMPGLIRSSMVIKLLFPGVSAPGWLIVMASPLYALLAYVILIIPYQFTGSGWFIAGVLGVVAGQAVLARAGFALARPMTEAEALVQINKVRRYYLTVMVVSAVLIIVALGSLVWKLNLRWTDVVMAVLKFESNVLILTMIGADLVVTNLDKARKYTHGRDDVEDATEHKIAAFVSFEAPPPPPPGPAM